MLYDTLKSLPFIKGIDLDIEESVSIINVKKLINSIVYDFGKEFIISMTPLGSSLAIDEPGLGGFIYKDLFNSPEGSFIHYFNCQCYYNFDSEIFNAIVDNGYPPNKIVMGMLSSQYNQNTKLTIFSEIQSIINKYPNFGGVFDWEYFNAYPSDNGWSLDMGSAMKTPKHVEYTLKLFENNLLNEIEDKKKDQKLDKESNIIDKKELNEINKEYLIEKYYIFAVNILYKIKNFITPF
jgi:hypothetical protein